MPSSLKIDAAQVVGARGPAGGAKKHETTAQPASSRTALAWHMVFVEAAMRDRVDAAVGGKIGYSRLPCAVLVVELMPGAAQAPPI